MQQTISPLNSRIALTTTINSPKKRTINKCADVLSSHGELVDYERQSNNLFRFHLNIKRDRIQNMIDALEDIAISKKNISTDDLYIDDMPYSKPSRVNITLTFLQAE